jgi:N-formylglutamate deformylase
VAELAAQSRCTHVVDGRFKGGYITRHYGRPDQRVHALQLEMCWSCYLADEAEPQHWSDAQAATVQPLLRRLLETLLAWRPE